MSRGLSPIDTVLGVLGACLSSSNMMPVTMAAPIKKMEVNPMRDLFRPYLSLRNAAATANDLESVFV